MKIKLTFLLLLSFFALQAQNNGGALLVSFNFGGQKPAGDLFPRFGNSLAVGTNVEYMTDKSNIIFGVQHSFIFGAIVKEDVLYSLRNENGIIFGDQFAFAEVQLRERGFYTSAHVGKLFSINKENERSGIRVHIGAGLLQHKIRIQDDPNSFVPTLTDERKKGYDRLTNGLALNQFIGYQHLSKNRLANFFIGIEAIEGFTQNRRTINVDTGIQDRSKRLDILWSAKIGWILPFYIGEEANAIYY